MVGCKWKYKIKCGISSCTYYDSMVSMEKEKYYPSWRREVGDSLDLSLEVNTINELMRIVSARVAFNIINSRNFQVKSKESLT
ncbi:hypothetical protein H5410_015767 [Solanum commersonii]|uniref:Uncharacterized protein n=1 Tax=Solanum commersonii TaxID=4109 RepID=A0A9J5ZVH8_SOLCO|nr:hypothetical protein H5410_015767 [Solanum commersonii]